MLQIQDNVALSGSQEACKRERDAMELAPGLIHSRWRAAHSELTVIHFSTARTI
jgi:hypothetical protein